MQGPNGLQPASWAEAFAAIKAGLGSAKGNEIKAIAGKLSDAETMIAAKDLLNGLGSGNTVHEDGANDFNADIRSAYIANSTVAGVEEADVILLIGSNPRWESPVFNARLRKTWQDGAQVALLGAAVDLTYPYQHLGSDPAALSQLAAGGGFFDKLKGAKKPVVIVGPGVFKRPDRDAVLKSVHALVEKAGEWRREEGELQRGCRYLRLWAGKDVALQAFRFWSRWINLVILQAPLLS